ncbi:hypothetical protein B0H14DRAFT_2640810 [Mycena olivaceomarginata]|nr:hypothetical protein B0H14DRAFT_2640810 [Mycena olivaceomarginata]
MPKYEILHSGQYWQDVRRRAKEAREAIALREARAQSLSRTFGDGSQIFTFVPGHAQPFTNLMDRSGKLHRVSELSSAGGHDEARAAMLAASWKKRHSAEEKARALRAKKLQQAWREEKRSACGGFAEGVQKKEDRRKEIASHEEKLQGNRD